MIDELIVLLKSAVGALPDIDISAKTSITEDLGLDSIGVILFALSVEDNYDIRFEGAPKIDTLGDMISYINKYRQERMVNDR